MYSKMDLHLLHRIYPLYVIEILLLGKFSPSAILYGDSSYIDLCLCQNFFLQWKTSISEPWDIVFL